VNDSEELPTLLRRFIEAKKRVEAEATPEEIEEARVWQAAFRQRAVERRKRSAARRRDAQVFQRNVIEMAFAGRPTRHIAAELNTPVAKIEATISQLGIPRRHKSKPCRTPPLDLRAVTMDALERFAADLGKPLPDALEVTLEILGEDGARALRRLHRLPAQG
jgi:hypothetical protein